MITRRTLVGWLVLVFLLAFTSSAEPAPARSANLRIGLPGLLASSWPVYAAAKQGFFKQEGLDVEMIEIRQSTLQLQALSSEDIQISKNAVFSVARAAAHGLPVKFIGSAQQKPNARLIVNKSIRGWEDLKGKILAGGSPGGPTHAMLVGMLDINGLSKGDYQILSMGISNDRLYALRVGRVAGALLSPPDDFILLDEGFKSLGFVGDYLKDLEYNGFAVNTNWAARNSDTVVAFMRAMIKATTWIHRPANKNEAIKVLQAHIPFKPAWLEGVYDQLVRQKMLSTDARPNLKAVENTIELSVKYGVGISSTPPLNSWVDLSYVEKATASLR